MLAQIGFLAHQVTLTVVMLGSGGASALVAATAASALVGRLLLVRFADVLDARWTAALVLLLAAAALVAMAAWPQSGVLVAASMAFGLTIGNVTTLPPIVVRRELGAGSFGTVYGAAAMGIQLAAAAGPGLYGLLHDASGGYRCPLLVAAALDVAGAALIVLGRRGGGAAKRAR